MRGRPPLTTLPDEKRCTKCQHVRLAQFFANRTPKGGGLKSWCRICYAAYGVAYRRKVTEARRQAEGNAA